MNPAAVTAYSAMLADTNVIQSLTLDISPLTVPALSRALAHNTSLTELELYCEPKLSDAGAEALGLALRTNTRLKVLRMHYAGVSVPGSIDIAKGLTLNNTLRVLSMKDRYVFCFRSVCFHFVTQSVLCV